MEVDKSKRVFFGFTSGICEALLLHPVDTIKVLKQSNQLPRLVPYLQQNSIRTLYKGLTPFTSQMGIKYILRFSTFESLRSPENSITSNLLAGIAAGLVESSFITPFELVKTNLQTTRSKKPYHVMKDIWKEVGVGGVYRGFGATCFRQSINQGSNFTIYHALRKKLVVEGEKPSTLKVMGSALLSGMVGPILNNPFDVIKTRYMNPKYNSRYNSMLHAGVSILQKEGVPGLYRGIGLRLIRVGGGQAIVFAVFERQLYYYQRFIEGQKVSSALEPDLI